MAQVRPESGSDPPRQERKKASPRFTDGQTVWHRLQRSWPLTRTANAVNDIVDKIDDIALQPHTTKDRLGIQVQLKHVKQGSYRSKPAHLVLLRVTLSLARDFPEVCLEIRLNSAGTFNSKRDPRNAIFIGAYGPAHIVEASEHARAALVLPASMQMSLTSKGVMMIMRARQGAPQIFPSIFYVGVVVVHDLPVRLKVLPSTTDYQRAKVLRRTVVRPVILDSELKVGHTKVTCALQGEGGCHSSCRDFGPEHMTPDIWKSLFVAGEARFYDEAALGNWVKYA